MIYYAVLKEDIAVLVYVHILYCSSFVHIPFRFVDTEISLFSKGDFWGFLSVNFIQQFFIRRPSDSTVSEDAGIEPRTVAALALAISCLNKRLELIHIRTDLIHENGSVINLK